MTIRDSFVEYFGEENAVRVEEAAVGHLAEGPLPHLNVHAEDNWGPDPFRYLFLTCIGRDCFTRWRKWHGITAEYEQIRNWALEHADLHEHDGDLPDYLAALAGAYNPWINWEKAGHEKPAHYEDWHQRNIVWATASDTEFEAMMIVNHEGLKAAVEKGMHSMNHHWEGPNES